MTNRTRIRLGYLGAVSVAVPLWELSARSSPRVFLLVSSPSVVAAYINANIGSLAHATGVTLLEASLGLLLATMLSLAAITIGFQWPGVLSAALPLMVTAQVIPLIVLAPFFMIAFGIGVASKVAMAAVLCFFPTFVGMAQGYRLIPRGVHDLLDIYAAPRFARVVNVYLPLAMPSGMAGLKVSATLAVIGAIVAEFTGAEIGLGKNLFLSTIRLQPALMMASLFAAALLGGALYGLVLLLERRFGYWYLEHAGADE